MVLLKDLSVLILLVSYSSSNPTRIPDDTCVCETRCRLLERAITRVFWNYFIPANVTSVIDSAYLNAQSYFGIDFTSETDIRDFACQLKDICSVNDLADLLPGDRKSVWGYYIDQKTAFNSVFASVDDLKTYSELRVQLAVAAYSAGLPSANLPLNISYDEALKFFNEIVADYGSDFLSLLDPFLYTKKRVTIPDTQVFVGALINAESAAELAEMSGVPEMEDVWMYIRGLASEYGGRPAWIHSQHSLLDLVTILDEIDFMGLPIEC